MNAYHDPVIADGDRRCSGKDARGLHCGLLPEEHERPTVWRASLSTRNFDFEALGSDMADAHDALLAGLIAHAREYRLSADWFAEYVDDIAVREIRLGVAYRDREEV